MKRIVAIIITLALVFALAACGGGPGGGSGSGGGGNGGGSGSASGGGPETPGAGQQAETHKTWEMPGYFSFEAPVELKVSKSDGGASRFFIDSPDRAWRMVFVHVEPKDRSYYESFENEMKSAKKHYTTFQQMTIGGYTGYYTQSSEMTHMLSIKFPYGEATAKDQPNGQIILYVEEGGDALELLENPVVLSIIESVKIIGTHTHSGVKTLEQLADDFLSKFNTSLEGMKPDGTVEANARFIESDGACYVDYFFEAGAEVDFEPAIRGIITILYNASDNQKIYNVYDFRENPATAREKSVEGLVKQSISDFASYGMASADFGFYKDGAPIQVYITFGRVKVGGSDEPTPIITIAFR